MEEIFIEQVCWETHKATLLNVRINVFVTEQGVPFEEEEDSLDPQSVHIIVYNKDGEAIATGRLTPNGWIGRMAVNKEYRGRGIGLEVLKRLTQTGFEKGYAQLWLSAQTHAIPFYEKLGYQIHGEVYDDCNIPHQDMYLNKPELQV